MKYYFLSGLLVRLSISLLTAQTIESCGARAFGIGNATVTVSDEWALFYNIAGIATQKKLAIGLGYKNEYALGSLKETSFHLVGKAKEGGIGVSVFNFGNDLYKVTKISAGYAHKIRFVSLGIQFHYVQFSMENLGVRKTIVIDFGGIAELIPSKLIFGATILNLNQARINKETLPIIMKAGLSYRVVKKMMLNGEIEKDALYKPSVKAGLEYAIIEKVKIRTGINTRPFINYFGVGFQNQRFQLDYALSKHSSLGFSHCISIITFFNRSK